MIDIVERLANQDKRYHKDAFYYVARAIESSHEKIRRKERKRRHITGQELVAEVVDLASDDFGRLAELVFDAWGVRTTLDIGEIVFLMVANGILSAQESDSKEDFRDVCEFAHAFDRDYNAYDLG
ncbi:MAG: Minf_1886 family protein [Planctomycetota bacterium]